MCFMDETSNKWQQTVRCVVCPDLSGHAEFSHQYIFELYFSVLVLEAYDALSRVKSRFVFYLQRE